MEIDLVWFDSVIAQTNNYRLKHPQLRIEFKGYNSVNDFLRLFLKLQLLAGDDEPELLCNFELAKMSYCILKLYQKYSHDNRISHIKCKKR